MSDNVFNGMKIIARTHDAIYLRIPEAAQVPSTFADGQCSCGHCDGSGKWDTLMVPVNAGSRDWATTVHMPDSCIPQFLEYSRKQANVTERRNNLISLINTYNESSSPSVPRTDDEHNAERIRARIALASIRRNYHEGTDYKELSNGALWPITDGGSN